MRRSKLVEARKKKGKSQEDIAENVGVDRTTIGKWERNESTPYPQQREAYAEALGVTMGELAAMLSNMPPGVDESSEWLDTYLGMEQSATDLRAHEPRAVYGLLQTTAYVENLISRVGITGAQDTYVQSAVEQRLYRQKRVRNGDLAVDVIQPESALHLMVGDNAVMAEQLTTLAELAQLPNVTLRITTYAAGQYEARRLGDFVIMSHPWGSPRVHIEGYGGGRFITDADEVAYFVSAFEHAAKTALAPKESIAFIYELGRRYET